MEPYLDHINEIISCAVLFEEDISIVNLVLLNKQTSSVCHNSFAWPIDKVSGHGHEMLVRLHSRGTSKVGHMTDMLQVLG